MVATLVLRDQYKPLPAALVCLSPWVDLTSSGNSYRENSEKDPYLRCDLVRKTAQQYAGDESLDNHLISPVFADLCGLPPMFIQVGVLKFC